MASVNRYFVGPAVAGVEVAESGQSDDLVFAFDMPHRVGTVCFNPCEQCGPGEVETTGANAELVPYAPLFILAEAAKSDWERYVQQCGGSSTNAGTAKYFYFVRTD